jgi:hypothetical protein
LPRAWLGFYAKTSMSDEMLEGAMMADANAIHARSISVQSPTPAKPKLKSDDSRA